MSTPSNPALTEADRELAWAYALDALEGQELADAEARIATDAVFALEVKTARDSAFLLAASAPPVEPSDAAKARLDAALAYGGPFAPLTDALARLADLGRGAMEKLLQAIPDVSQWEAGPGEGIRIFHLDGGPATAGAVVGFVKIPAGGFFPEHTHSGEETVIVMQGTLIDSFDGSRAQAGDRVVRTHGSTHVVHAGDDEDLIFLVVVFNGVYVGEDFIGPNDPRL